LPLHSLRMKELSLLLRLGCSEEERALPQEVRLDVELRFPTPLKAGRTDDLRDTICYGALAGALRKHFTQEYQLIERVTEEAYRIVKEMSGGASVAVEVRKVNPPVPGLLGGAFFRCGDFP
jgi:dihydroneopterin aldolase